MSDDVGMVGKHVGKFGMLVTVMTAVFVLVVLVVGGCLYVIGLPLKFSLLRSPPSHNRVISGVSCMFMLPYSSLVMRQTSSLVIWNDTPRLS